MARKRLVRDALLVASTLWALPLLGQDAAAKPDLHLGDEWIYRLKGINDGTAVDQRVTRRIMEMLPDDRFRVEPVFDSIAIFDGSWNPRHPQHPDYWPLDFQFPLRVGAAWSYASPPGSMDTLGRTFYEDGHHRVVAYETIRVAAGTFNCFRLEGVGSWNAASDPLYPNRNYHEDWYQTRWYCPDVKYMAKAHIERQTQGTSLKSTHFTLDWELLAFNPGRPTVPASRASSPSDARYDGYWLAALSCDGYGEIPASTKQLLADVRDDEFVLQSGIRGEPGYYRVSGRPAAGGALTLEGNGIADYKEYAGRRYQVRFEGQLDGERFVLNGRWAAFRCALTLSRVGS